MLTDDKSRLKACLLAPVSDCSPEVTIAPCMSCDLLSLQSFACYSSSSDSRQRHGNMQMVQQHCTYVIQLFMFMQHAVLETAQKGSCPCLPTNHIVRQYMRLNIHPSLQALLLAVRLWSSLPADVLQKTSLLPRGAEPPPAGFFKQSGDSTQPVAAAAFFTEQHLQTLLPILKSSSSSHPRLHSLWPTLLALLLPGFTAVKVRQHIEPSPELCSTCLGCSLQLFDSLKSC